MREELEARQIAAAYYTAWTAGDFDEMMKWVADDVVCETPSGMLVGPRSFRRFWVDFMTRMVKRVELIALYGDIDSAAIVYSCDLVGAPDQPVAEWIKIRHGKISHSLMIHDQASVSGVFGNISPRFHGVLTSAA
ncbi:MAG: nuclear transport factor 2 family protein [Caulobacteraceae bacterium]|nr:nuclear transport factor 2 family protein [Caulobacteraceae bacterium]